MGADTIHDVAIVGGGPAGLSAAIWLTRYLHSVVLIDSGDPRNWETRGINAYLGLPEVRSAELRKRGRETARGCGATLIDGCVERVRRENDDCFLLHLDSGAGYRARRLLLAIGIKDAWPDIPGLQQVYGATAHVCPDCDGFEARDRPVAVIGSGRKAAGMALNLTTWTDRIFICTHGAEPALKAEWSRKLERLGIPVMTSRVASLYEEDGRLRGIELANGTRLECEHIFFSLAQYPADDLGVQLGCERDEDGHIIIDDVYHTSVRNVFAAGDIVPGPQLAIAAASDGAIAALAIHKSLVPDERKLG